MSERIYLSPPHMGDAEFRLVSEAFESNWIAPVGPHVDGFENDLSVYNNTPYCVALSSGTAAIHLALVILGTKPGDEVICSSFTFAGSCFPINYVGAVPVFIDSERETWNMDPALLEVAIQDRMKKGKKPKAIIVVHLYGMPAKIEEIMRISARYEIPVIEDAAEALGSTHNGQKLGSFGDFGVFSFNGNKIITTSGGGALVSKRQDWIKKAKFLSTQAREPFSHYEHVEIGFNYRLSNICAAIGRGQLMVLEERVRRRRQIFDRYKKAWENSSQITLPLEAPGQASNRWLSTILVNNQSLTPEKLRLVLESHNIESRPLWKPMHLQPVYKGCLVFENGTAEKLFATGLCLPSGTALTDQQIDRIINVISATIGTS